MRYCTKLAAWVLSLLLVMGLAMPAAASGEASAEASGEASEAASVEISEALPATPRETYPDGFFLPVFETSDIHGCLVDTASEPYEYRMAYIADKVRDARGGTGAYDPSLAILLDSGDIYQGNALSNLLDGVPMTVAFDRMDYDAVSVGNHEFDWDVEAMYDPDATMLAYTQDGQFYENPVPVLATNLLKDGQKIPFAEDYVILEKTAVNSSGEPLPVRIGVIGFADDYAADILYSKFTGAGYTVDRDYSIANDLAAELESAHGCDATILLVHGECSKAAEALGETCIDLVLGGHTHGNKCGETDGGTTYLQPRNDADAYAYGELAFAGDGVFLDVVEAQTVNVSASLTYNIPENAGELDPELLALSEESIVLLDEALNANLGYVTVNIDKNTPLDGNERSTTAGNWVTSMFARAVEAEVGFYNGGGIRTDLRLPSGDTALYVTVSDIYTMLPFGTGIYCYELTWGELLELLTFAVNGGSHLYSFMTGVDCYYTDGIVNALVRDGEIIYRNGIWSDGWEEKTVRVAAGEYIATSKDTQNLLYLLQGTEKLLSTDSVDNECSVAVLRAEAEASGGLLHVDTKPHLIEGVLP